MLRRHARDQENQRGRARGDARRRSGRSRGSEANAAPAAVERGREKKTIIAARTLIAEQGVIERLPRCTGAW